MGRLGTRSRVGEVDVRPVIPGSRCGDQPSRAFQDWNTVARLERPGTWTRRVVVNLARDQARHLAVQRRRPPSWRAGRAATGRSTTPGTTASSGLRWPRFRTASERRSGSATSAIDRFARSRRRWAYAPGRSRRRSIGRARRCVNCCRRTSDERHRSERSDRRTRCRLRRTAGRQFWSPRHRNRSGGCSSGLGIDGGRSRPCEERPLDRDGGGCRAGHRRNGRTRRQRRDEVARRERSGTDADGRAEHHGTAEHRGADDGASDHRTACEHHADRAASAKAPAWLVSPSSPLRCRARTPVGP